MAQNLIKISASVHIVAIPIIMDRKKSYMKGLAGLRQRLAELADINKKIIVEEAVKVLVLVLAVVIILVAAIFSVKAIDRHNESIAVNNIRKEIIDGR